MNYGSEPTAYRFRLMPSGEVVDKSVLQFSIDSFGQGDTESDTAVFLGPTSSQSRCDTCGQTLLRCPGHSANIRLPFHVVHPLIAKEATTLLTVLCIRCGNIPITEEQRAIISKRSARIRDIVDAIKSANKLCPYCNQTMLQAYPVPLLSAGWASKSIVTLFSETPIQFKGSMSNRVVDLREVRLVDNNRIHHAFEGLSEKDAAFLGFTNEHYHPRYFMLDQVCVAPPSARPSTARLGKRVVNSVKGLLRTITTNASTIMQQIGNTTLDKLDEQSIVELLREVEPMCIDLAFVYAQPSDDEVNRLKQAVSKRQQSISIISYAQLPGKKQGNFRKYILGARHGASARTVATAAPYARTGTIAFPKEFAMTMAIPEAVTELNIQLMRMLARNGPKVYPGANGIVRNGRFFEISEQNKNTITSLLMPGDILERHVMHGDIVLNNRYPSLREESVDAMFVVISEEQTFGMPLAGVEKKGLDFDGDAIQCFLPSRLNIAIEAIMLQSQLTQFIAPKNAWPAIYGSGDVVIGIKALVAHKTLSRDDAEPIFANIDVADIDSRIDKVTVTANDIFSLILPKGFYYDSPKITITDGRITAGSFQPDAVVGEGAYILKAVAHNFGSYAAMKLLENATMIAYAVNRIIGQSISNELWLSPKNRKAADELVDKRVRAMDEFSRKLHSGKVHVPFNLSYDKFQDILQNANADKYNKELIQIMQRDLAGGMLDQQGVLRQRETALLKTIITVGQIVVIDTLPPMILAGHSRTLPYFRRYVDTAISRGYIRENFMDGVRFESHFFDCMAARHQIFSKGVSVATQGYFERTLSFWLSSLVAGYLGEIRNDSYRISSYTYGHLGLDVRRRITVSEDLAIMSTKSFDQRFDGCAEAELKALREIRRDWQEDIMRYANFATESKRESLAMQIDSPIDFECLIKRYAPSKSSSATPKALYALTVELCDKLWHCHANHAGTWLTRMIDDRIRALKRILLPALRTNRLVKLGYSIDAYKHLCEQVVRVYRCALIAPGEPVGLKAALSLTEPLTQAVLHAIHKLASVVGTIRGVERTHDTARFAELLQGIRQKHPVTTFVLRGDKKYDQFSCMAFANEIETVTLSAVMQKGQLLASSSIVAAEDTKIYTNWLNSLPMSLKTRVRQMYVSPFKLRLYLSSAKMLLNRVTPASIAKYVTSYAPTEIAYVAVEHTQEPITRAYVFFSSAMAIDAIRGLTRYICTDLVVNANGKFRNASVQPYKYNAVLNEKTGELERKMMYRIEANGKDLAFALQHPDVDPNRVFSNDTFEMIEYFGLAETRERLYEELIYETGLSSNTASLLKVHFQIIVDYLVCRGQVSALTRHGIRKNMEADPMAKMAFEETQRFLKLAVQEAKTVPLDAAVPRTLYGLRLKEGTGLSNVRIKTGAIGSFNKSSIIAAIGGDVRPKKRVGGAQIEPVPIGQLLRT